MRVLIAEDDPSSRMMLKNVLEKIGYDIIETSDGRQALDVMKQPDPPLLLILDWNMPEMNGIEVLLEVRKLSLTIPPYIIMLTVKDGKEDIVYALEKHADDYISKPYDPDELRARTGVGVRMIELNLALAKKIDDIEKAFEEIKMLKGIVPICASCKKIRDDSGYWHQLERFISEHTDAEFSHGYCPECAEKVQRKRE